MTNKTDDLYYNTFEAAFVEALLWSETCEGHPYGLDNFEWADVDGCDFTSQGLELIKRDCADFYAASLKILKYPTLQQASDAGHDFCLTRNGHGAGFWDGDWPEPLGTKLTELSETYDCIGLMWQGENQPICVHN